MMKKPILSENVNAIDHERMGIFMTGKNMMSTVLGIGLASAAFGMYVYNNSKPSYQKKIQRGVANAVDEMGNAVGHATDAVRKTMM